MAEFIKGTEYMVAKKEDSQTFTVAVLASSSKRSGEIVEILDKEFGTKAAATSEIKRLLKLFPDIEITYLNTRGEDMAPWFKDWEHR